MQVILTETYGKLSELTVVESSPARRQEVAFLLEFMLSELRLAQPETLIEPRNLVHEFILAMIDKREDDAANLENAILHLVRGAGSSERQKSRVMMFMVAPNRANELWGLPDNGA